VDLGLAGTRVIVTAAGAGIGAATARRFAALGARVWICDVDPEALARVTADDGIDGIVADVADTASVDRFVADGLAALGGVDVLVNNAGIAGPAGLTHTLDPEAVTRSFDVNLTSMFRTLRQAVPAMIEQRSGLIVNISSTAGQFGFPYRAPYAAAKWGVIGLTKTLAMELGEYGIRANAICPGSVAGPRMDLVIDLEAEASGRSPSEIREGFERQVSMRTFVDANDIADTIAYLASPLASKVTGQVIAVDGNTESLRT
jgi:NAD(P)-dependent dehydrogenase (short-subunit alcohol dehydrogenase family)